MVINTNIQAQINADNLTASQSRLAKSLGRLSSGSKIISPGDDAAGLAVSSKLDAQIQRMGAAKSNVGNAMSFTQTQDGYLGKVAKALNRMSELSLLSQDVTKTDADRSLYQREFDQLNQYIQDASKKEFNGVSLFSANTLSVTTDDRTATFGMGGVDLGYLKSLKSVNADSTLAELGAATGTAITDGMINIATAGSTTVFSVSVSTTDSLQSLFDKLHAADPSLTGTFDPSTGKIALSSTGSAAVTLTENPATPGTTKTNFLESTGLSSSGSLLLGGSGNATASSAAITSTAPNISTVDGAKAALSVVVDAISSLAADRARVGAYQQRLTYVDDQLTVSKQNMSAASSRIEDVDVADEATEYAKQNILVQSGTAMLAQANQMPQSVLRLLQ